MATETLPSTKLVVQQYWAASRQQLNRYWTVLALPLAAILTTIIMPYLASHILAQLITDRHDVWQNFWLFVVAAIAGTGLNYIGIRASMSYQAIVMNDLQNKIFSQLIGRSAGFFANQIGGKLISDATTYIQSYGIAFNTGYNTLLNFSVTTVIGLLVVTVNSPLLGLLLTGLLATLLVWSARDLKTRTLIRQDRLKKSRAQVAHLSDSLVNALTVKVFAREKDEMATASSLSHDLMTARIDDWTRTVSTETQRMSMLLFAQVILILTVIILTKDNPALLATSIFAFTYSINLLSRFFAINVAVRSLEDGLLEALPMAKLLTEPAEIKDHKGAKDLKVRRGLIKFQNVNFDYVEDDNRQQVFADLNLTIQPAERVGLVGHSGGGKTTLTRLLLRFDDIQSGTIAIDDQDIAAVTQVSLRDQLGYVPQEPLLFHRSIKENIAYGQPGASLQQIKAAAKQAAADDFINQLPKGYDTIVGERGVKLSGGQRQRVAIARAILKSAPILVLDEATSALDSESEQAIQAALWQLMENKTAIVIAHRLSTIQKLDRIVVIDDGKIVESGTHKQLLKTAGQYAKLWQHQSGGFLQD